MKSTSLCVLVILCSSILFAQSEQLPDFLKTDTASESEARRMGGQVFKLLPRGRFDDPSYSYTDKENPIGIRGGGAYFSFASGSHSYNKIPQITLTNGDFCSGFGGYDYGFFTDLGRQNLSDIGAQIPEVKYFLSYKPPLFEKDLRQEQISMRRKRVDQITLLQCVPAVIGKTYLLRAINWNEADTVVAIQVLNVAEDGSVIIAWKKLLEITKPFYLFEPDEDLEKSVTELISEEKLFDIQVTVKDNWLFFRGTVKSLNAVNKALSQSKIRYRGETLLTR